MRSVGRPFERHSAWRSATDATGSPRSRRSHLCFAAFRALMCTLLSRNVHRGGLVDRYARWNALLELLAESGRVSVEEAAERLDVSQATIRRDFDQLAQQQMITRTRGGAVANGVSYDLPLRYKSAKHSAEKQRIGEAAAGLVSPEIGRATCRERGEISVV